MNHSANYSNNDIRCYLFNSSRVHISKSNKDIFQSVEVLFVVDTKKDYNHVNNLRLYEYIKLFVKNFKLESKK